MKLFNRWETSQVQVVDPGLQGYINIRPLLVPRTGGRNTKISLHKKRTHIVERLINKMMVPGHRGKKHKLTSGHCPGKSIKNYQFVEEVFKIIEQKTNKNPIEVFVRALENATPREEITTIEYGGAKYPQAVECSPQRRLDIALRVMAQGAYAKSFNSKKKAVECMAEEIIKAYNMDPTSASIAKKLELERQADASR